MTVRPLPAREGFDDREMRDAITLNLEQLAEDIRDLRESDKQTLRLCTEMRDQCVRLADEVLSFRQVTAPASHGTLQGLGPHRERLPTLPEIVEAIQTGQHGRLDSHRVQEALDRQRDKDDAATLRRMKGAGWRLFLGVVGAILGVLATGFAGHLVGKLIEHK
jgi:hypothetical protein